MQIRGARVHNLSGIDLDLPLGKLVVLTGVSGSGKSSLAIDTIFAEGQRRFLESLPARKRLALNQLPRPDVDTIHNLPPTICIDQRGRSADRRSTLATLTGIADFLRLLYARAGEAHCPGCGRTVSRQTAKAIVEQILRLEERKKVMILAPWVRGKIGSHAKAFEEIGKAGFVRARVNGEVIDAADPPKLEKTHRHEIAAVVDRLIIKDGIEDRVRESIHLALKHGDGSCLVSWQEGEGWKDQLYSERFACPECERSFPELQPRSFSFNSPYGACPNCQGLGVIEKESETQPIPCPECNGARLNEFSRAVTVADCTIGQFMGFSIGESLRSSDEALSELKSEESHKAPTEVAQQMVSNRLWPEIRRRLEFLAKVGLDYLTLDRPTNTLSGGEFQRARLAACLGTGLRGACYVLDEPTTGLHPRDTLRLLGTLTELRDQGNTVLVVEHDLESMRQADWLVDLGPGAGTHGGRVVAAGTPPELMKVQESLTAAFLQKESGDQDRGSERVERDSPVTDANDQIVLTGARRHNLKNVTLKLPLGCLVCVTGVSGSGKSSLISETLVPAVRGKLSKDQKAATDFDQIKGWESLDAIVEIDQSPLGRSAQSTPATYSKIWDELRKLFATTRESRVRGFKAGRFSFNSRSGQCPECKGRGNQVVEMHFLPDVEIECPACKGARFNRQTLAVQFRGKSPADVLAMPMSEAVEFFENFARLKTMLATFVDVGLGYLLLGQSAKTLSGGEAQRVKLASHLARPSEEKALFVLDEPTTGLHPADVQKLIQTLKKLTRTGQSVIVVEHQEAVMAVSDWIIDLGPDGGANGGEILAEGAPLEIAKTDSPTGRALTRYLAEPKK